MSSLTSKESGDRAEFLEILASRAPVNEPEKLQLLIQGVVTFTAMMLFYIFA